MIEEVIVSLIAAAIGGSKQNQIEQLSWWMMAIGTAGRLFAKTGPVMYLFV